jgi:hemin uptake protein HemP
MSPDTKPVPDMAMDDEDHNDSLGTFGQHYTESDSPAKPSRTPLWIMMASAVVVIALSIGYSGHVKQILPFVKNWQIPEFPRLSAEPILQPAQKTSINIPITGIQTTSPLDLLPNRFSESQQAMSRQPPIDNPKITQLENQLASLTMRVETQQQTYTAQFKALESQLKTLQQHVIKQQAVRIATKPIRRKPPTAWHKTQAHQPTKAKTAIRKSSLHSTATTASAPEFTLASIDHWGDKTQAVLRHHGQLYTLVSGSTLSGWTVIEFAEGHEGVYMANRHGQRRLLALD